ncbi:hypothetical protein [Mollivirus kamchatka]|nr:hypothetical protein [Mollivirus kamchatka]
MNRTDDDGIPVQTIDTSSLASYYKETEPYERMRCFNDWLKRESKDDDAVKTTKTKSNKADEKKWDQVKMHLRDTKGQTLVWQVGHYGTNGAMRVCLVSDTGEPWAVLSVNVPGHSEHLPPGHFFAKNYSENRGLVEELAALDVIEVCPDDASMTLSYVTVPLVRLKGWP